MKKLFLLYHLFFFTLLTTTSTMVAQQYAKEGCNDVCGNVRIPYPFGIGANCSINKWYVVDCKSSTPYLSALNNQEILDVDLENQMVTVNVSMISDCRNPVRNSSQILNVDLVRSPFLFSKLGNKFVVEGCGNAVVMDDNGNALTGCSTTCGNDTINDRNNCLGISCCMATIPHYLKSYTMNLTGLERQLGRDGGCGSAFLVDEKSYVGAGDDKSRVPISLIWTLTDHDYNEETCYSTERLRLKLDLGNGTSMESWKCKGYGGSSRPCEGNPYF